MNTNDMEKLKIYFDYFCKSIGKIVSDKIDELNLERTVYGVVESADETTADVRLTGSGVLIEGLPSAAGKTLAEGDAVVVKYVGGNLSNGYIARKI